MNTNLKIEKGIPVPEKRASGKWEILGRMEVGDSIFIPFNGDSAFVVRNRINGAIKPTKTMLDRKFCTRKVGDGIRVWRLQ